MKIDFITKPCTHLHPAPSTSTQLIKPPPNSIHLYPALGSTLNVIRIKILHVIWQFPQILAERFKVLPFA